MNFFKEFLFYTKNNISIQNNYTAIDIHIVMKKIYVVCIAQS